MALNFTNNYNPTEQEGGLWKLVRGNPPGTRTDDEWRKHYNATDSYWRRYWGWTAGEAAAARECGGIRAKAIEDWIEQKKLPVGFRDTNP